MPDCGVCRGKGLVPWPCACGRQKPVGETDALAYRVEVGALLTPEDRQRFLADRYPGWDFRIEERRGP